MFTGLVGRFRRLVSIKKAFRLLEEGKQADARRLLHRLIDRNEATVLPRVLLADIHFFGRDFESALREYNQASANMSSATFSRADKSYLAVYIELRRSLILLDGRDQVDAANRNLSELRGIIPGPLVARLFRLPNHKNVDKDA